MKKVLKRLCSFAVSAAVTASALPLAVFAEPEQVIMLPEAELEAEIYESDVFYLGTLSASLPENGNGVYSLKIGRGGSAETESTALLKVADITAKYGKDYYIRYPGSGRAVAGPEESGTLLDMMDGADYTQSELADEDMIADAAENDPEFQKAYNEAVSEAVDLIAGEAGITDEYGEEYAEMLEEEAQAAESDASDAANDAEESEADADAIPAADGETVILAGDGEGVDEVQQARAMFLDADAVAQRVEAAGKNQEDAVKDLQKVANFMTDAIVGAEVELTFAPGETEKYIEIVPIDNFTGDGSRIFYAILGAPTGTTTNSAASSCAFTIQDDEKHEQAKVSFSQENYVHTPGEDHVTVEIEREGALGSTVSAVLKTTGEGNALVGRDYSEVERELLFPFGVSHITVDIPVRTEYFSGDADFGLELIPQVGCTADEAKAMVSLKGTYFETVSQQYNSFSLLAEKETEEEPSHELAAPDDLSKVKLYTGNKIDISKPRQSNNENNKFGGHNEYNSKEKRWQMDWEDRSWIYNRKGTVFVGWNLEGGIWLNGARVKWSRSGNHADMGVSFYHSCHASDDIRDFGRAIAPDQWNGYDWQRNQMSYYGRDDLPWEVDLYPSGTACICAQIGFYNHGRCDDCNWLRIYSIQQILRPFQAIMSTPVPVQFLQEDGTMEDSTDFCDARITEGLQEGKKLTRWLDDSITVYQPAADNMQKYVDLSAIQFAAGDKTYTLASKTNAASSTLTWKFSKENLNALYKEIGDKNFEKTLKKNEQVVYDGKDSLLFGQNSRPDYCEFKIQPVFSYIDSKVSLRNTESFPVVYTISGTEYRVEAGETKTVTFHKGDKLYCKIDFPADAGEFAKQYKITGFKMSLEQINGKLDDCNRSFTNGEPRYISSSVDALKCRNDFDAVTLDPLVEEKANVITVKIKNSELDSFEEGGILTSPSTKDDDYTYFTFADTDRTFIGRRYSLFAVPADYDTVPVWYDKTTARWYEGTTFFFTAGDNPAKNEIELTVEKINRTASMSGTIRFVNFNTKTNDKGDISLRPASFANISAGFTGANADENGFFKTEKFDYCYDSVPRYIRYVISANGGDFFREVLLPDQADDIDITSALGDGISPIASGIFRGMGIEAKYPKNSYFDVLNGNQLPIVDSECVNMTVSFKPSQYTSNGFSENGVFDEKKTEAPLAVQFIVYGKDGKLKHKYEVCDAMSRWGGEYQFKTPVYFSVESTAPDTNDSQNTSGEKAEKISAYRAEPGDELYLRLTTDRDGGEYTYSDVFTGYVFHESAAHKPEVEQGIDGPLKIDFATLPFLGDTGMNFNFPFLHVGYSYMPGKGYRMYIGVNVTDIYDKVKDTSYSKMYADDGVNYAEVYSFMDTANFIDGIKNTFNKVFRSEGMTYDGTPVTGCLGSPQMCFDLMFGIYFDFWTPQVVSSSDDPQKQNPTEFIFAGVGGYVAVSADFKISYYFMIPVIFIPAYINVSANANIMGMFGAEKDPTKADILYTEARDKKVDFNSSLSEFSGEVKGGVTVSISGGIGLCGVAGLRAHGDVSVCAQWLTPSKQYSPWGANISLTVGIIVDLFVYSHNFDAKVGDWNWGSFKEYKNKSNLVEKKPDSNSGFTLSSAGSEASEWHGSTPLPRYALTPAQTRVLASNAYEHPDSQLITMRDGTAVLVFVDSDPEKSPYQRTTLKISVCKGSTWSEPVEICNDGTADFQPSVAEMKDGRLLAAWVSTNSDSITDETPMTDYFSSMDVFASFIEIGEDGTAVPEKPVKLTSGAREKYYDSMPTVVCDMVTGDAIVYYTKSGRTEGDVFDIANPYTNDSVICYMLYNAEADTDTKNGKEVSIPKGWLFNDFYDSEYHGNAANEEFLITNYGGQRFLDSPTFEGENGAEFYAIPDFTAIAYNGFAVYAYTIDKDSSNDTYNDKEIMLQVYNFQTHETKHRTQITDDDIADAMPQLFRSQFAEISTGEESTHTKLFWYRDNKNICYIDVTKLLQEGIDENGVLIASDDTDREYTYVDDDGSTVYTYIEPILVSTPIRETNSANQSADFRVAEDANGSLFVLWTEGAEDEEGNVSSEIFASSLYTSGSDSEDETDGGTGTASSWTKPYQITRDGYFHDEMAAVMSGDKLIVVYNKFSQNYDPDAEETLTVSDMSLMATTLEACGAVEPETIAVQNAEGIEEAYPTAGEKVQLAVEVSNNGLTPAAGYQLSLYAVSGSKETLIGKTQSDSELSPNSGETQYFEYTMPDSFDGMTFKAVTQELRKEGGYYLQTGEKTSEPLKQSAHYVISNLNAEQKADGFHLDYKITNNGNAAASAEDQLIVDVTGPFDLYRHYTADEQLLSTEAIGELEIGESRECSIIVEIPAEMFEDYRFITAAVRAVKPDPTGDFRFEDLSVWNSVDFDLVYPIHMTASDITVEVGDSAEPTVTMELAELLGGSDVTFSLDDTSAARLEDGKIFGVSSGYATLYAVHDATGAAVTAKISVTSDGEVEHAHRMTFVPAKDATETEEGNTAYYVCEDCEKWFEDEAGTKEITDRSSVVIPVIDPEVDYIAPLDELCTMALVDYRIKNGVNAASAEAEKKEDGSVSIVLSDDEGNVLDTYDIDPTTGIGTDSDGEEVNLPQTGNNSSQNRTIAVGAFLLIIAGGFCIASSARIRRRKEEEAQ